MRLGQLNHSIKRLVKTHYPGFVFGFPLPPGEIPVFVYHEVEPQSFSADLEFLRNNGYCTLSPHEFLRQRQEYKNERSVLLTFDDARRNFWEVAFPLLAEFKAKATLFAPTYWMRGHLKESNNRQSAHPGETFMTWDQLRTCSRSGLVDVQSHAHRHALVYTSAKLIGFASPRMLDQYDIYDWPMRRDGSHRDLLGFPPLGSPIYEATPLLSARFRFLENLDVVKVCQQYVAKSGGPEFFSKRNWRAQLHQLHRDLTRGLRPFARMIESEFQSLVESEFLLSRQLFESELGAAPCYFAFPWMLGSDASLRSAAETGIRAVFGVGLDFRRAKTRGAPVPAFSRIKGDWLRFLPGRGRLRLAEVLPLKVKGFIRTHHLAH